MHALSPTGILYFKLVAFSYTRSLAAYTHFSAIDLVTGYYIVSAHEDNKQGVWARSTQK